MRGHSPARSLAWLGAGGDGLRTLAEIAATVDLERVLERFRATTTTAAPGAIALADAAHDPHLGARVLLLTTEDGGRLALAEPSTEGRLARSLARHGEGPAGAYLEAPFDLGTVAARAAAADVALSAVASGPFGPSVLVLDGSGADRHLILVDPAAVPSRP